MRTLSLRLVTKRLLLREWKPSDWKSALLYTSDRLVVRFMPWGPNDASQTRDFIRRVRAYTRQKPRLKFEFAVVLRKEDRLIGGCGLRVQNAALGEADLGYCLHRDFWGQGYATELTKTLMRFGFSKLRLHRIWATCDPQNKASARVLEKAGLRREAHFRKNVLQRGQWRDSYLYAALKSGRHS